MPSPCQSAVMQGSPMDSVDFLGLRLSFIQFGKIWSCWIWSYEGTGRMWKYFNIFYMMMVRLLSLQRRARTSSGHNGRKQKEGHLPWGILGTKIILRRGHCVTMEDSAWWWNRSLDNPAWVRMMTLLRQANTVHVSVGKLLRDVVCQGTWERFLVLFTAELWFLKSRGIAG